MSGFGKSGHIYACTHICIAYTRTNRILSHCVRVLNPNPFILLTPASYLHLLMPSLNLCSHFSLALQVKLQTNIQGLHYTACGHYYTDNSFMCLYNYQLAGVSYSVFNEVNMLLACGWHCWTVASYEWKVWLSALRRTSIYTSGKERMLLL